jgi:hypothetical protein
MAPSLTRRVLDLARKERAERAELEARARALVLCPPDCDARNPRFPGEHCHTYWDMLVVAPALDYGWKCQRATEAAQDATRLDTRPHLLRAGVAPIHLEGVKKLDEGRAAIRAVRKWLALPLVSVGAGMAMSRPWLVLTGPGDCGKTQAAAAVLDRFIRQHPWNTLPGGDLSAAFRPFVVVHAVDFATVARQFRSFSTAGRAHTLAEEMLRAKVLVLDDVGTERMDAEAQEFFQRVVNERYASRRATVWTTNLSPKELEGRLDFGGDDVAQKGRLWRRIEALAAVVELSRRGSRMTLSGRVVPLE